MNPLNRPINAIRLMGDMGGALLRAQGTSDYGSVGTACAIICGDDRLRKVDADVNSPMLVLLCYVAVVLYGNRSELTLEQARQEAIPMVADELSVGEGLLRMQEIVAARPYLDQHYKACLN